MNHLTVKECRAILGESASGHSDEQIERQRDSIEVIAALMYEEIARQVQKDPEAVRWMAYAIENPDDAYDKNDYDYDDDDEASWQALVSLNKGGQVQ